MTGFLFQRRRLRSFTDNNQSVQSAQEEVDMYFLITILMIHFIFALIENRTVKNEISMKAEVDEVVRHPAEFSIR